MSSISYYLHKADLCDEFNELQEYDIIYLLSCQVKHLDGKSYYVDQEGNVYDKISFPYIYSDNMGWLYNLE